MISPRINIMMTIINDHNNETHKTSLIISMISIMLIIILIITMKRIHLSFGGNNDKHNVILIITMQYMSSTDMHGFQIVSQRARWVGYPRGWECDGPPIDTAVLQPSPRCARVQEPAASAAYALRS